jgi:prephenate dehydratase
MKPVPRYDLTYQGQPGAFSEDAAFEFLPPSGRLLPSRTLQETFDAVAGGAAAYAIVPVENTLAGPIDEAYELLAGSNLSIVDEAVQPISHCLIGPTGMQAEAVRRVLSHPIALAQCAGFLRSHPEWEAVSAFDTAGAVEDVLRERKAGDAAIGSARSAGVYGGEILLDGIQDHPENYTRFLLLSADAASGSPRPSDGAMKTSVCFRISDAARRESGVLRPFVECGVPLANVLSRPVVSDGEGESVYHLDFIGSIGAPMVQKALDRIRKGARDLKVLGTYPLRVASIREVVRPARASRSQTD